MAAEESKERIPPCNPKSEDCNSSKSSEEKMALVDFAYRLGSCSYTNEPGIAAADELRQEAKLLMCLCASPPRNSSSSSSPLHSHLDPVSASESEASLASESSCSRNRDSFTFTCPSLSLESSDSYDSAHSHLRSSTNDAFSTAARRLFDVIENTEPTVDDPPVPARLLGRPLKVDDRDALRLSADAMARNIRQSYQKALKWRIQAWIHALSKTLVQKELEMAAKGASKEELRGLLESCEARLILHLREVADSIQVDATATSFQVLGQCDSKGGNDGGSGEPAAKKIRLDHQPPELEEGDYQYKVSHVLLMECVISLHTPAGFSEVTLQVPGTMEGTFLSTETGMEELKSIVIELDTHILSVMLEKSCRSIAFASVEAVAAKKKKEEGEMEHPPTSSNIEEAEFITDVKTPPALRSSPIISAEDVRAALVTPRAHIPDKNHESSMASPKPMLMPIPDNFEDFNKNVFPRRISPQPHVPYSEFDGNRSPEPFTPRTTSSSTTTTSTASSANNYFVTTSTISTTSSATTGQHPGGVGAPSLVSPQFNEAAVDYHRVVPENGPSLPMLCEAACRVMQDR